MHSYDEVLHRLYEILAPHADPGIVLVENTDLVVDLGLDSPRVLDLVLELEEHFDVSVPMNVLPDVQTIGDLARQIQQLIDATP
ncbi:MAG: acyl carrier protein [Gammaproteobacteria bacterium]|nr:acyl carrier protein [Gammaproteobacteria bacterium]